MTRTLIVLLLAIGALLQRAAAQVPPSGPGSRELTATDLEPFASAFIRKQLVRSNIAGAVIVAVKGGTVLLSRGYGFADIANRVPMTDATVVRPGSISKLFTAIAVLQLVEKGKLRLDRDVNDYLNFRIPTPQGGTPVTLRLLLTHRAGFEDHFKDLFATGAPEPLEVYVRRSAPHRLFIHGDVPAYSNYGYALAGYVAAGASGERFEDYAASHILKPLGMDRSTFEQPLPPSLASLAARGYPAATSPAVPYFESVPAPAGGLSATAIDMGRFMVALLNGNPVVEAALLRPLAFEEDYAAGNRFIGKHGLTNTVVSDVAFLPEAGFGLFVSYNSASAWDAPTELLHAIADRYFRRNAVDVHPSLTGITEANTVAGVYEPSRREDSTFVRIRALLSQIVVQALPGGRIRIPGISRRSQPLVETAPFLFVGANDLSVRFRKMDAGKGMAMSISTMPLAMEWQRVPRYLDRRFVVPAIQTSLGIMLVTVLLWPAAVVVRKWRKVRFGQSAGDRREYVWVRVLAIADLLSVAEIMQIASLDLTKWNSTLDPWLIAVYVTAWLGVAGSAVSAWVTFRFWRDHTGSRWARAHQTLLGLSMILFAWFSVTWRIAGTSLNY